MQTPIIEPAWVCCTPIHLCSYTKVCRWSGLHTLWFWKSFSDDVGGSWSCWVVWFLHFYQYQRIFWAVRWVVVAAVPAKSRPHNSPPWWNHACTTRPPALIWSLGLWRNERHCGCASFRSISSLFTRLPNIFTLKVPDGRDSNVRLILRKSYLVCVHTRCHPKNKLNVSIWWDDDFFIDIGQLARMDVSLPARAHPGFESVRQLIHTSRNIINRHRLYMAHKASTFLKMLDCLMQSSVTKFSTVSISIRMKEKHL